MRRSTWMIAASLFVLLSAWSLPQMAASSPFRARPFTLMTVSAGGPVAAWRCGDWYGFGWEPDFFSAEWSPWDTPWYPSPWFAPWGWEWGGWDTWYAGFYGLNPPWWYWDPFDCWFPSGGWYVYWIPPHHHHRHHPPKPKPVRLVNGHRRGAVTVRRHARWWHLRPHGGLRPVVRHGGRPVGARPFVPRMGPPPGALGGGGFPAGARGHGGRHRH